MDEPAFSVVEEFNKIQEMLSASKLRDHFELVPRFQVGARGLASTLMQVDPHVVHFCGHGSPQGELVFRADDGAPVYIDAELIARVFGLHEGATRCVVLNACYSDRQAELIAEHIAVVIGMSSAIPHDSALAFAEGFYQALGHGKSVQAAFEQGKLQIPLSTGDDTNPARMHIRNGVSADMSLQSALASQPDSRPGIWHIVLEGRLIELGGAKHESLLEQLRQLTGDPKLTIMRLVPGSIIVEVHGTSRGMECLRAQLVAGTLELAGFRMLAIAAAEAAEQVLEELEERRPQLEQALKADPSDIKTLRELLGLSRAQGRWEQVEFLLEAVARYTPYERERRERKLELVDVMTDKLGDIDGALRLLATFYDVVQDDIEVNARIADALFAGGRFAEAGGMYRWLVEQSTGERTKRRAHDLTRLARIEIADERLKGAQLHLEQAYRLDATNLEMLRALGGLHEQNERWTDALHVYRALQLQLRVTDESERLRDAEFDDIQLSELQLEVDRFTQSDEGFERERINQIGSDEDV